MTTYQKNEPVDVTVKRAFRYKDETGKMKKARPAKKGMPKTVTLPYQFAREMEAAQKVSFETKGAVEIDNADKGSGE